MQLAKTESQQHMLKACWKKRTHAAVMASLKDEYTELADMNRAQH
jgi:hypothetical protein